MTQNAAKTPQPKRSAPQSLRASLGRNRGWLIGGASAAVLGAAALLNHANARRAEADNPPAGKFVDVDGVRLHYVDRGTGSPIVLLHGNGAMLQDFEVSGVLDLAAGNHRVLAFDRPGFGYSDRPRSTIWTPQAQAAVIAAALTKLGVGKATIVGHSWGTMVALAMALEHSDLVSGLVLLSGYYYGTARPDMIPMSTPAIPLVGDVMAHTISPLFGALIGPAGVKASFAPAPIPDKFKNFPHALALRPSQVRATAADTALMLPGAIALSRHYGNVRVPVIIMAGEGDLITHLGKHAERLAAELPGAELRVVLGQGHLFHYAVPDQVIAAIGDVAGRRSEPQ